MTEEVGPPLCHGAVVLSCLRTFVGLELCCE